MSCADPLARYARSAKASPGPRRFLKIGLALLVGALIWLLFRALELPSSLLAEMEVGLSSEALVWGFLLVYVVLLAIPFVPGAEIGLAIMLALGSSMAAPVYAATLLGLSIAFAVGRHAHPDWHRNGAGAALRTSDALANLNARLRERPLLRRIVRYRGLAFIFLLNMPGNSIVGGGGGIAMAVGYSRALTFRGFLGCAAIAVAPVPGLFLVSEHIGLENWVHERVAGAFASTL